ncbi:MAG: asparagine synthase (glutamine-hydrolyzing) [Candidatus Helarchaeota archaeon]|nr:asparagine synthase (glutamine-hydrolyzing) [Candidatus Helarchaeota archaeon]
MCGIVGIFAFNDLTRTWQESDLDAMVKAVSHRGPDGQGKFVEPGLFLGHTRLAIIDLSSEGNQPMLSSDGRFVISYNGEIYNYRALRQDLEKCGYHFRSNSDTEVLLTAWQEWGETCLGKLDGIFVFSVYDRIEKELYLVRDHFGIKPLFYWFDDKQIVFASELLALFGSVISCPEINPEDLDTYFTFNYLPAPRTGLKSTFQLPPAHLLKVKSSGIALKHYWKLEDFIGHTSMPGEPIKEFYNLLTNSVVAQMVSDVPLGLFLSGGLDSYTVARAAVSSIASPQSFTLGFDETGFDETPTAKEYARYLQISNRSWIFKWTEAEIIETLGKMNELLADASCFPVYQLSRWARQFVTVVLSGDGGDELLAGYDTYLASGVTPIIRLIPSQLRRLMKEVAFILKSDNQRYGSRMVVERMFSAADEGHGRDHASFRRIFSSDMKKRLYEPDFLKMVDGYDPLVEYTDLIIQASTRNSYLTARQYADFVFHMPSILAKVDRMSMASGLEVRVPILNRRLVEFCLSLPDELKRRNGKGKWILREALKGKVPQDALRKPKAGFLPPVNKWFRSDGPMACVLKTHLEMGKLIQYGWLRWGEVEKVWEDHQQRKIDSGFELLSILQFLNWSSKCQF